MNTSRCSRKLLVFLRSYNDIDHIVPVIYKWLSMEDVPVAAVLTAERSLLEDYRLQFLTQFSNFKLHHLSDFSKHQEDSNQPLTLPIPLLGRSLGRSYRFLQKHGAYFAGRLSGKRTLPRDYSQILLPVFDALMMGVEHGVVVLDWTTTDLAISATKIAKERHFTTVSLPHGDAPYYNQMIELNSLDYSHLDKNKAMNMYDYTVVPNKLCGKRYEPYLKPDRLKILGSPRYNDEWLESISALLPVFNPQESNGKLKIVLFMRDSNYSIFYEELLRTIRLVLQFPDVYLVMKHHTRNVEHMMREEYVKKYTFADPNLKIVYNEQHSGSLISWADIVMDLGTSVVFEAVKRRIPVLSLEYLHSNYSTVAHYIKRCEIKCRDDLYDTIAAFSRNRNLQFYDDTERNHFIQTMIDFPDKNVLERYVQFLRDCLTRS